MAKVQVLSSDGKTPLFEQGQTFIAFKKRQKEAEPFIKCFCLQWEGMVIEPLMNAINPRVLMFCFIRMNREGKVDYTQKEIAFGCGVAGSTVSRSLKAMLKLKILLKVTSGAGRKTFWINPELGWKSTPASRINQVCANSVVELQGQFEFGEREFGL